MVAWHIGAVLLLFRWIFQDPKVDVRFLALGAILPDVIDIPIGTVLFADQLGSGEVYSHTLLAPTVFATVVLLATRRGRRRRAWMALVVGWFLHLLLDGMWTSTEAFLWPFFGLDFPPGPSPYWSGLSERAFSDPWRWATELVGIAYLVGLARVSGLNRLEHRKQFLATGRLPVHTEGLVP